MNILDLRVDGGEILSGHLKLGGTNPRGDAITVNSRYIEINGKPFIPVMGEMHYSRFPNRYWEEEILKIKAAGINMVSFYIIWIHHEEVEGDQVRGAVVKERSPGGAVYGVGAGTCGPSTRPPRGPASPVPRGSAGLPSSGWLVRSSGSAL